MSALRAFCNPVPRFHYQYPRFSVSDGNLQELKKHLKRNAIRCLAELVTRMGFVKLQELRMPLLTPVHVTHTRKRHPQDGSSDRKSAHPAQCDQHPRRPLPHYRRQVLLYAGPGSRAAQRARSRLARRFGRKMAKRLRQAPGAPQRQVLQRPRLDIHILPWWAMVGKRTTMRTFGRTSLYR